MANATFTVTDQLTAAAKVVLTVTALSVVVIDQPMAATAPKVKADRLVSVLPDPVAIDLLTVLTNQPTAASRLMVIDLLMAKEPAAIDLDTANQPLLKPKQAAAVVVAGVPSMAVPNRLKNVVLTKTKAQ